MSHYVYLPIIPEKGTRKTEMSDDNQQEVGIFFVIGDLADGSHLEPLPPIYKGTVENADSIR